MNRSVRTTLSLALFVSLARCGAQVTTGDASPDGPRTGDASGDTVVTEDTSDPPDEEAPDVVDPPMDAEEPPPDVTPPPMDVQPARDVVTPPADVAPPRDTGPGLDAGPVTEAHLAGDITLRDVAIFQSTRIALATNGAAVPTAMRNAPVVAGRDAAVRAYVVPGAGFTRRMVTAELVWSSGAGAPFALRETRMVIAGSADAAPNSVFTFRVPGERVTTSSSYAVRVLDESGPSPAEGTAHEARYPRAGSLAELEALPAPGATRITLVPVRWTGDGSNRLPDTSPEQLQLIRRLLVSLYPITEVEFTVHEPIAFGARTLSGSVNFGSLNGVLEDLRDAESPDDDVYYYALVSPATSRAVYCGRSCVTGQSYVVSDIGDASIRVGGGMGFTGEDTAWTLAHELGHLFGRSHAPCDTSSSDRAFPYRGGVIGVWGWDPRDGSFLDPNDTTDFMGYCDPQWVSDYTYRALFARADGLRPGPRALSTGAERLRVHVARLNADGSMEWAYVRRPRRVPTGSGALVARYFDANGAPLGTARASFAELAEEQDGVRGHVFVPEAYRFATSVELSGPALRAPVRMDFVADGE